MSWTLFKKELRTNYKLIILFLAVVSMYAGIIISMYDPDMNSTLEIMAESMPEFFAAFGMMNVSATLIDFITNYLYGFILIVFPFLLSVILCYRLIGRYIDHGSMAYLLATPVSRQKLIITQLMVLLTALLIVIAYAFGFILVFSAIMIPQESIDVFHFLCVNIGLLGLHCFFAGICYLSAVLFNEARLSIGVGAGIGILFIMIQMLSQVSDKFDILHYLTPLTLFDPQLLSMGEYDAFAYVLILYIGAIFCFVLGQWIFQKRDLPL